MSGRPALPRGVFSFEEVGLLIPAEVVLDTSFVVAALNSAEPKHSECVAFLRRLTDSGSLLVHNRLLEVELAEVAFKLAVRERHGNRGWPAKRADGRVRRRAGRLMKELHESWREIVATSPSLCIELEEVVHVVPDAMHHWGLGSYDAVHAATASYTDSAIVTLDSGFGVVPTDELTIYIDQARLASCRRRRGGRGR